jgi:hypothetical protein
MTLRTLTLATALTAGLGSAAMAQAVIVEQPDVRYEQRTFDPLEPAEAIVGGVIGGVLGVAPRDRYYVERQDRYYGDDYNTGYMSRGSRKIMRDEYNDETGVNNN